MEDKSKGKLLRVCVIFVLALAGLCGSANAVIVEPDAFTNGTLLNNAYPGVTLSAVGTYIGDDDNVYALIDGLASTGTKVFGNSWTFSGEWGFDTTFQPHLRVDFDSLVISVEIDAIGGNLEDYGRLEAYSSTSVLLNVYETGLLQSGDVETMSIFRPSADIAYILAAGKDPGSAPHHTVYLDNLNYVIPEPATFLLLSLGAVLLRGKKGGV